MATTVSTSDKRCVKCGKDVNGQRRMKDPRGQYWCYDCGSKDEASKGSGSLVQPCPACGSPVHAANMVRNKKTGKYTCDNCQSSGKSSGGGGSDEAKKQKIKVGLALACMVLGGFFYWYLNVG
jgi:predicted RNA-binding Zn-ribbon protein involved in translation (DUF1610 family)